MQDGASQEGEAPPKSPDSIAYPYKGVGELAPIVEELAKAGRNRSGTGPGSTVNRAVEPRRAAFGQRLRLLAPVAQSVAQTASLAPSVEIYRLKEVLDRLREIHGADHLEGLDRLDRREIGESRDAVTNVGDASARIRSALASARHRGELMLSEHDGVTLLSSEEHLRAKRLRVLLLDGRGGRRRSLIGTDAMLAAIDRLRLEAPHCQAVITVIENAARLSLLAQQPLSLPPILLVGPPGTGKSTFAEMCAQALGTTATSLAMSGTNAWGLFQGLPTAWKGAAVGKVAQALIDCETAGPIITYDEIDKVMIAKVGDRPLDPLHGLWEQRNAAHWIDDYYDLRFDARHIIHVATANSIADIAPSLLDRVLVLAVPAPGPSERRLIAERIYASAVESLGDLLPASLSPGLLDRLAETTPRRMTRLLGLAIPAAVAAGRSALVAEDLEAAARLIDGAAATLEPPSHRPIGFITD